MVAIESEKQAVSTETVQNLADLETLFTALSQDAGAAVAVVSKDGQILFANDAAKHVLASDGGASVAGRRIHDFRPTPVAEERLRFLEEAFTTGGPVVFEATTEGVRFRWVIRPSITGATQTAVITGTPASMPRREGDLVDRIATSARGSLPVLEAKNNDLGILGNLTKREIEVLSFIGQGLSTQAIGKKLGRSVKTIEGHRVSLGVKLGVTNRVELARIAIRAGLAPFDASADGETVTAD